MIIMIKADPIISGSGGSALIRTTMAKGVYKGIHVNTVAIVPCGSVMKNRVRNNGTIIKIIRGVINVLASRAEAQRLPIARNKDA